MSSSGFKPVAWEIDTVTYYMWDEQFTEDSELEL